ncbi:ABC transporter substrate-binding protein [Vibrio vulnificus]|uniref:ABC transporter substrate-binding protein n=1 Tax=Vibrio vulnificus TaxID=672 RepID=UPI0005F1FD06|nr:ABC transporter substrate-binding protein [Vibrio vulnificus]EGQ7755878.1 carbohydrate ABC transporter substrate-binding protein [Vibrio vulnificus]EGR1512447.1 carbohydrate ABC transporter substrate-binding protein [Vibrio vulnificus]ELP1877798.1 carbohydrate ABC transporter substrate-binding protein [Vibrio vulnificus]RZQ92090.1 carbohydrate ABC transporter substrate-binding protein [Vibrio vulnificus]HDY7485577.1 carbohydrate ABC transporter substrate-binding protein [Vibrio vulnificus]
MTSKLLTLLLLPTTLFANEIEFLHWWTSPGETAALTVLEKHLKQQGLPIQASAVNGGGGDSAMTVLQARALAGNTPSFAQIEGPSIKSWDAIGILHPINQAATQAQWDNVLYPLAIEINKTSNGYVALPLTLHRLNILWTNHRLLKQLNLAEPQTWPELFEAMEHAKQAGIMPLAIGDQPWQIAQLFESLVIAAGGVTFYKTALVQLDKKNIDSAEMRLALRQLRHISLLTGHPQKSNWDSATKALAEDKALFQLGGDWILGDLLARGVAVPQHVGCRPAPQSHRIYLYNMDSFIFMASKSFQVSQAEQLASALADKTFQQRFNQAKGSIPVRKDIDLSTFNVCQQQAFRDFQFASANELAVPSMTDSMAVNPVAQQAINSEIFRFFRNPKVSEDEVIRRILSISVSH